MQNLRKIVRTTLNEVEPLLEGYYTTWKKLEEAPIDAFNGEETAIVQKLVKHFKIGKTAPLGSGTSGFAYHIPNNQVLKITKDKSEAAEAHKIKGKKLKHLANVYETYALKGRYEGTYVIISELLNKNEDVKNSHDLLEEFFEKEFGYSLMWLFEDYSGGSFSKEQIKDYIKAIKEYYEPSKAEKAIWFMNGMFGIINDIKINKIHSTDWGVSNLGIKKDGNLAMYDLGYGDPDVPNAVNNINLNEEKPTDKKRKVYVLIGPPAVGKSTFIKNNLKHSTVISRDDIATAVAARFGITYDELFSYPLPTDKTGKTVQGKEKYGKVIVNDNERMKQFFPLAFENIQTINTVVDQELNSSLEKAIGSQGNIVIDMTNMDKKGRAANLGALATHPEFEKIAIVFKFQDPKSLSVILKMAQRRSEEIKAQGGSKTITPDIMKRIISKYEEPTSAEGFDKILHVNTIGDLTKALNEENVLLKQNGSKYVKYSTKDNTAYADVQRGPDSWHIVMIESKKPGGGTLIVKKIIEDAKKAGAKKITLTTTEFSGWGFFDKLGFKEVGDNNDPHDIPMELTLNNVNERATNDYPEFTDGQFNPAFHNRAYPPTMNVNSAPIMEAKRNIIGLDITNYILEKLGYANAEYLGSGVNGDAYSIGDKVIKITKDESEAKLAHKFINKNFKHIANVYKVSRYEVKKDLWVYIIIMEKLQKLNGDEKELYMMYDRAVSAYENYITRTGFIIDFDDMMNDISSSRFRGHVDVKIKQYLQDHKKEIINIRNQYLKARNEIKKSIKGSISDNLNDMHSGNVGLKPNGNIAYYDLRWWDFSGKPFTGVKAIKEIELSSDELNKKELPIKYHYKWGDFIQSKGAAVREIMPNIGTQAISNVNTNALVRDLAEKEPAVYDEFAEWIYQDLHSKSTIG